MAPSVTLTMTATMIGTVTVTVTVTVTYCCRALTRMHWLCPSLGKPGPCSPSAGAPEIGFRYFDGLCMAQGPSSLF